jgi:dihydrofolate synthase/folylpolyglutamate synthase
MTYDVMQWLDSHINFETDKLSRRATMPTLDRMKKLCAYLGDPQEHVKSIHITGTNGKTSTTRVAEVLLRTKGLYTGMIASPHLSHANERICLDGHPITIEALVPILQAIKDVEDHVEDVRNDSPSWFEIIIAASFYAMSHEAVDVGLIEVGMGGRYDATNVCASEVSVFTNIELDHMAYLGSTRGAIAHEKSGIIKPGNRVVISERDPEIVDFLRGVAKEQDADVWVIDEDFQMTSNEQAVGGRLLSFRTPYMEYSDIFLPLFGAHQGVNALTAVVASESFIDAPLGQEVVEEGCAESRSPGRMEIVHREPLVLVDGAHNVAGAQTLATALEEEFGDTRRIYILGLTQEKDPVAMINALNIENDDIVIATQSHSPRSMESQKLADAVRSANIETVIEAPSATDAIENALALALDDDQIVVTGSLYVVGEVREALHRQA